MRISDWSSDVCSSDLDMLGLKQFPVIGGHEGAGEIVEVGPGVKDLAVGDHVVLGFIPACGKCPSCAKGKSNLCDYGAFLLAARQIADFTARHHATDGTQLGLMCLPGTFDEYPVVHQMCRHTTAHDTTMDKPEPPGLSKERMRGTATP